MGFEVMKNGLHKYFNKFSWKNTTLDDFVGCMDEAFKEKSDTSMGNDFSFKQWCDNQLHTSGINILEPELEFSADQL